MINDLNYANSDDNAQLRYDQYRNVDPLCDIDSALLNTADIADYVCLTGMIYPFDPEKLKSASYEMDIGGEVLCWDENNKEENYSPLIGQEIKLRRNSITFVTVNSKFRLPDYIAMRFNLQIEHVHKGILLGTGPLINPGFTGRLMIPLHNLTNNDYFIKCGDPLIGIEFTKLSYSDSWGELDIRSVRNGQYKKNTKNKSDKTFHQYIEMFIPRGKIVKSSLSSTLDKAERSASKADTLIRRITRLSLLALAALLVALSGLSYQVYDVVSSANNYVLSASQKQNEIVKDNEKLKNELIKKIDLLEKQIYRVEQINKAHNK